MGVVAYILPVKQKQQRVITAEATVDILTS